MTTLTATTSPDWALVPFDVSCARCGHDLRGLTDAVCPACELEFDWSVAVPIEKLTCETCDYHLYGLTETRCPECGTEFTWEGAIAAYHQRRQELFEYRWRDRPVRSYIRSTLLMFRPGKLWQVLHMHDQPRVGPLIAMAVVAFAFAAIAIPLLDGVYAWMAFLTGQFPGGPIPLWRAVMLSYTDASLYSLSIPLAYWSLLILAFLLLLRQTRRRHNIMAAHVLRIWAYTVPVVSAVLLLFLGALSIALQLHDFRLAMPLFLVISLACLAFLVKLLREGYRQYLKLPHAWGIAVSAHVVALLIVLICFALMDLYTAKVTYGL